MIDIHVKTNGDKIFTKDKFKDITLQEVSLITHELEKIKQRYINVEFDTEIEINNLNINNDDEDKE